jgi:hypothetical protein
MMMTKPVKYDARLTVLCPAELPQAINAAAAARLQRPAEYIRAAILARLQADGVAIGTPQPGDGDDVVIVRTFK